MLVHKLLVVFRRGQVQPSAALHWTACVRSIRKVEGKKNRSATSCVEAQAACAVFGIEKYVG